MERVTTQEHIKNVAKHCGLTEEIVRSVMNAEKECVINYLKTGRGAILPGRCIITPVLRHKTDQTSTQNPRIKLRVNISKIIESQVKKQETIEKLQAKENKGQSDEVVTGQIPGLV